MRVFGAGARPAAAAPAASLAAQQPALVRRPGAPPPPSGSAPATAFSTTASDLRSEAAKVRAEQRERLFREILDVVDLKDLYTMDVLEARDQLGEVSRTLLSKGYNLEMGEQDMMIVEIINDILGLGPLESLLARDDIADIMVCGPKKIFIEVKGKLILTDIQFRNEEQLRNVASRIVQAVGRRVDESSPICDARLKDGSRVAIVIPPIAIDGTNITIRKFKKDKLKLDDLVKYGSISPEGAKLLEIISACRMNILVSGGTGSGKTTLLNCLTRFIDPEESIITCEDAAELQLQQPNVRRWETRPANLEGAGEIQMSQLVKAALRHRPERIIIGEVRGPEAFDLLQAMNTGHDGSAGTVHSNSPREAIARVESLIAMGGFNLPASQVREQIVSSIDVVVQSSRLRDGSRKITHITELVRLEGDKPVLQDLMTMETGEEVADGTLETRHIMSGVRPTFWERARYYGREQELMAVMGKVRGE